MRSLLSKTLYRFQCNQHKFYTDDYNDFLEHLAGTREFHMDEILSRKGAIVLGLTFLVQAELV